MHRNRPRRTRRAGLTLVLLAACAALALGAASTSGAKPNVAGPPDAYVTYWDTIATQAYTASGLTAAEGHVILAYLAVAVYDSVMAIEGGYEPFANDVDAPAGASAQAAVAAAAHRVLEHYLPAQEASIIDPAYTASLATIGDGQAKTTGVALGEAVADLFIAQRANDGFRAPTAPYVPPSPPVAGVWIPTGPTPIGPYLGGMDPFALKSADQFRPLGPPALDSKQWAQEFDEVKQLGSSSSTIRTAEQTVAARFWGEAPVQQAHGAFRKFMVDRDLDVVDAARFMAMVSVAYADGLIACFEAKYHFLFWRPITAIRAGDTDGNDETVGDATWSTLLPGTPNHPEYPSAHSCITPTAGPVIARFLGTNEIDFTIPSLTGLGDRHYDRPADLESDVANARIWGGIHFRSAVVDGADIAKNTANYVLSHNFKPSND